MWPEAYNSKNDKKGQTIMYDMQKTKDRTTLAPLKPRDEQLKFCGNISSSCSTNVCQITFISLFDKLTFDF